MQAKQKDVPASFCKAKCCAFRNGRCDQITAGPGNCLWQAEAVAKGINQGFKK